MNANYRWILLIAISLIAFIINVDYTAVNLALIPMSHDLNANLNTIQWVLSGYVLAWAVLVIPGGSLADKYQKKSLCIAGIALFIIASLLAGFATNVTVLIAGRILQGMAGAIYISSMYALIYLNFSENERGRAIGIMSLGVGLGMALGPFIGGVLLSLASWRAIFFINIPIGLIAWLIIVGDNKKELLENKITKINKTSVIMLSISMISILYALSQWRAWQLYSSQYISLAAFALLMLSGLFYLQSKLKNPLIPLKLFSNMPFLGCCIGMMLEQYAFSTIIVAIGLYLQIVMQQTPLQSSIIYLSLTIVFGVIAAFSGSWVDRIGIRVPTVTGLLVISIGSVLFTMFSSGTSWWSICFVFLTLGVGMGLAFSGLNTGVVKTVQQENIGIASSVFLMCALLGNSFGVTFTTMIYQQSTFLRALQFKKIGLQITNTAFNYGVNNAMLVNALVCLFAFLCCALLLEKRKYSRMSPQDLVSQQVRGKPSV